MKARSAEIREQLFRCKITKMPGRKAGHFRIRVSRC